MKQLATNKQDILMSIIRKKLISGWLLQCQSNGLFLWKIVLVLLCPYWVSKATTLERFEEIWLVRQLSPSQISQLPTTHSLGEHTCHSSPILHFAVCLLRVPWVCLSPKVFIWSSFQRENKEPKGLQIFSSSPKVVDFEIVPAGKIYIPSHYLLTEWI